MSQLSQKLIKLKQEKNVLQKDIAEAIGVSLRAYQYYEQGEREPNVQSLKKLATYFSVTIDYLLGQGVYVHEQFILEHRNLFEKKLQEGLLRLPFAPKIEEIKELDFQTFMLTLSLLVKDIDIDDATDKITIDYRI